MKITISRWLLFSHPFEEQIELTEDLIEEALEWAKVEWRRVNYGKIEDADDFFEVLEKFLADHVIDDPIVEEITKIGGDYYPGNDGHDENRISYDEPTQSQKKMINKVIARFNKGKS